MLTPIDLSDERIKKLAPVCGEVALNVLDEIESFIRDMDDEDAHLVTAVSAAAQFIAAARLLDQDATELFEALAEKLESGEFATAK